MASRFKGHGPGEEVRTFIPFALPPRDPPLDLTGELTALMGRTEEQLRLLDLAGDLVLRGARGAQKQPGEVLKPLDERKKNRAVVFKEYLDFLRQGTEL